MNKIIGLLLSILLVHGVAFAGYGGGYRSTSFGGYRSSFSSYRPTPSFRTSTLSTPKTFRVTPSPVVKLAPAKVPSYSPPKLTTTPVRTPSPIVVSKPMYSPRPVQYVDHNNNFFNNFFFWMWISQAMNHNKHQEKKVEDKKKN